MAELVRAQPTLKIEYLPSLSLDTLATMSLLCLVHDFEGLHEWLLETAASLPPRLRHDMNLCLRIGFYPFTVVEAIADAIGAARPGFAHDRLTGLEMGLGRLTPADCATLIGSVLSHAAARHEIALPGTIAEVIADQERLEDLLRQLEVPLDIHEACNLIQEPVEWRDLLISTLKRFWERIYAAEYALQQPQRERNVAYHRSQGYIAHFPDYFATVTGRLLPDSVYERMGQISRVRFIPSLYIGPYLAFLFSGDSLTVFYNSRATPADGDAQTERIQGLYQPLAALADKTRLQIMSLLRGRELYAQEIVNLLDIHQSAVSRHLKLMETSGMLTVRREKGAKYYSINQLRLEEICVRLRELL